MADYDLVLGVPRSKIRLLDDELRQPPQEQPDYFSNVMSNQTAGLESPEVTAGLPRKELEIALGVAPPEWRQELLGAIDRRRAAGLPVSLDADPGTASGVMAATQAMPAQPVQDAPVAEATPEMIDQAGREAQARTEALMQNRPGVLGAGEPVGPAAPVAPQDSGLRVNLEGGQSQYGVQAGGRDASQQFPISVQPTGEPSLPAPQDQAAEPQLPDSERRLMDAIEIYKGIYKGWDGSPETAPNPALKALAEAAIAASVERSAKLAEQHGQEQEALTKQIAEAQKQAADYSMDYSKAAEAAAVERDRRAQEYDSMIRKAQADLDRETKSLDPHRMLRGGRGLLLALFSGMGAFGASYNKTPNWAGQYIDDALDKDFQAQKDRVNIRSGQMSKAMELYNMFRLRGMEDAAAKAAVHALVKDYYANYIASIASTKQGLTERQASQAVASGLREQAEIAKNTAILESAAGKAGKVTDIVKLAQEAVQRGYDIEKTQAEIRKLNAEADASGKEKPIGEDLRSKQGETFGAQMHTIQNIEEMISLVRGGKVGYIGSRLATSDEGKRFDVLRRTSLETLARSFGASTTDSDRKAAARIEEGWIPSLTPAQMISRLEALLASAHRRHKIWRSTQDPRLVDQIEKDYLRAQEAEGPATPSTSDYANRFGGHL